MSATDRRPGKPYVFDIDETASTRGDRVVAIGEGRRSKLSYVSSTSSRAVGWLSTSATERRAQLG